MGCGGSLHYVITALCRFFGAHRQTFFRIRGHSAISLPFFHSAFIGGNSIGNEGAAVMVTAVSYTQLHGSSAFGGYDERGQIAGFSRGGAGVCGWNRAAAGAGTG